MTNEDIVADMMRATQRLDETCEAIDRYVLNLDAWTVMRQQLSQLSKFSATKPSIEPNGTVRFMGYPVELDRRPGIPPVTVRLKR